MDFGQALGIAGVTALAPVLRKYAIEPLLRSIGRLPDCFAKKLLLLDIGKRHWR